MTENKTVCRQQSVQSNVPVLTGKPCLKWYINALACRNYVYKFRLASAYFLKVAQSNTTKLHKQCSGCEYTIGDDDPFYYHQYRINPEENEDDTTKACCRTSVVVTFVFHVTGGLICYEANCIAWPQPGAFSCPHNSNQAEWSAKTCMAKVEPQSAAVQAS